MVLGLKSDDQPEYVFGPASNLPVASGFNFSADKKLFIYL